MQAQDHESPNLIPPVAQPTGWRFFLQTWSGRLILLNALVFALELYLDRGGVEGVSHQTLLALGAKDNVHLALGQYWRFFTPIFLHGNLLHFAFNNWALYVVAYQLEALLRPGRFLLLYLLAGVGGNIASALWSLNLSIGASGALFGLMGCALTFERTIQSKIQQTTGLKPRTGVYTVMVVANILFGFIIPQIDNAAHIGGLLVGVTFAYALLRLKPNRLVARRVGLARTVVAASFLFWAMAAVAGSSPHYVAWRLDKAVQSAENDEERYYYLSMWLQLQPSQVRLRWHRFGLALRYRDLLTARMDFRLLSKDSDFDQKLTELMKELDTEGNAEAIQWLQRWMQELN